MNIMCCLFLIHLFLYRTSKKPISFGMQIGREFHSENLSIPIGRQRIEREL